LKKNTTQINIEDNLKIIGLSITECENKWEDQKTLYLCNVEIGNEDDIFIRANINPLVIYVDYYYGN